MDRLLQDLRFALRQLTRTTSTTVVAVLTLALGIGANTSVFTLLNATLFKAPPASDPDRLVWLTMSGSRGRDFRSMSYPDFVTFSRDTTQLAGVVAYASTPVSLGGDQAERMRGYVVSGNYFDVIGVRASLGRTFTRDDDAVRGGHPVVVIGDGLWRRRFGASPRIIDSSITVNGHTFTVIGVAPPMFTGIELDDENHELWLPLSMIDQVMPTERDLMSDANAGWLRVIARLRDGTTIEQAQAAASAVASQLVPVAAGADAAKHVLLSPMAGGLDPANRSEIAPVFALLSIVPLLVLLVACANVANLQLARALSRRRELAMRRALGASRARLVRQLLTESVLLSVLAGGIGVVLSFWLTDLISRVGDVPAFLTHAMTPDARVLMVTTALSLLSGVIFGVGPALVATRQDVVPSLKDGGATLTLGRSRHRLRGVLVVAQVTVSLVLIVTAGLFMRSLDKALRVDPGFEPTHAVKASFDLSLQGYADAATQTFHEQLLRNVRALPGVEAAALSSALPFSGRMYGTEVVAEGAARGEQGVSTQIAGVSPDYFRTLRTPMVRGRDFTAQDNASSPKVVIVNQTLAKRLFAGRDAIGQRIRVAGASDNEPLREIIGVAQDGKYGSLTETPRGYVWLPGSQAGTFAQGPMTIVARTTQGANGLLKPVADVVKALDPNLPLFDVRTLERAVYDVVDKQRAASALLGVFGALALLLAALGMYGVTAHGVSLRTREIGIRMSLGARASDVLTLFVRDGVRRSLVGVALGLALSAALSRVLSGFLFGLTGTDLLTFAAAAAVLCGTAAAASYIPARRAARVDPMNALRSE